MKTSKRKTSTEQTELVETQNLLLSLNRLDECRPYDMNRWRRALYHALAMSRTADRVLVENLRNILGLP